MNKTLNSELPVMEHFYSLQGEGMHQGRAAYFVRLGGCDVGCVWCDVKDSWDVNTHPKMQLDEIIEAVKSSNANFVVVTGGEPLMHNCDALTTALHANNIICSLETSGAYPLTGQWDWICISPKKFKAPLPEVLQKAHELKVVVFNKSDFKWAEEHRAMVGENCKLYLQAEWSKKSKMYLLITEYVQQNAEWKVSVQIHKYLDLR